MMKILAHVAVMLSVLLISLIAVGSRVSAPIALVPLGSTSQGGNGDDGIKANSGTAPESPSTQTYTGGNDNDSVAPADSVGVMWVEPSLVSVPGNLAAVGYKFNVTVWLNMTEDVYSYEIGLLYNRTLLRCDRAGFTDGGTSEYFTGHYSSASMVIDTSFLGNGSILAYEGCMGDDYVSGPRVDNLVWAEFEILTIPQDNLSLSSKFDLGASYEYLRTWVQAPNEENPVQIALSDGYYEVLATSDLSVSVNPAAVTMNVGQSQPFESNVTGGTPPYSFQWYNDYDAVPDGTGSNWTFTSNTPGIHQVYLEVTDSSNTVVTSNFVPVDVASPNLYNVTLEASCDTEGADISVPITMDGSSTGLTTPHTFTNLTGTHSFTVPSLDSNGEPFTLWDQGSASTTIVLSNGGTYMARYGGDQWPANAMWIEPQNVSLTGDSATVGFKFNITVWLNMTQDIRDYQIGLLYNRTLLRCDRAGFTDGRTSIYFEGHYSTEAIAIDPSALGNGGILACECCLGDDNVSGPRVGSLIWAEFEVLTVPSSNMSFASKLDISTEYPYYTWVVYSIDDTARLQIAPQNGNYEILGSDVSVGLTSATVQPDIAGTLCCVEHAMRGFRKAFANTYSA